MSEEPRADETNREERYAIAAQAANDGLWDWDLKANDVYYSSRWKAMLGLADHEVGNTPDEWLSRVHSKDLGRLLGRLSDHLHRGTEHFDSEHRVRHRDGGYRWMRSRGIAVRDPSGEAVRVVGWQTDITDRKRAEERLQHEAWHDPLTDLPNRAHFQSQLQRVASQSQHRPNRVFALLFLDLDDFKKINDTHGHAVGDQLLMALADRLRHSVRPGDTIARLGGDEFAVLLRNLNEGSEASQIAERILRELAQPFKVGAHEVSISASIGIALSVNSHDRASDLLRDADAAMYQAKALGRGRLEVYQLAADQPPAVRHSYAAELEEAFERGDLRVHYQPTVSLLSGSIVACEALLRWQHPDRGLLLPAEFLPVAEESGLIEPITQWLLRTACAQAKAWEKEGLSPSRMAVNIPNRQFGQGGLCKVVREVLEETGLTPSCLRLELTESALLSGTAATVESLVELTSLGVEVCLDDFDMGYSSLIYLRRLPIRSLKIDGFYVREISTDAGDATMAAGVIALAHSLGLRVIAERVETREQLEFLRGEECDELQGDVVSPALSVAACSEFLRRGWANSKLFLVAATGS